MAGVAGLVALAASLSAATVLAWSGPPVLSLGTAGCTSGQVTVSFRSSERNYNVRVEQSSNDSFTSAVKTQETSSSEPYSFTLEIANGAYVRAEWRSDPSSGWSSPVELVATGCPTITTQASPTSITVGTTVASVGDTATFSGASIAPTGDVTFTLYSDSSCTSPVSGVSGSGVITTSSGSSTASYSQAWTPSSTGTYYWVASYAGDSNNNGSTTACGADNEQLTVIARPKGSPTITTQASPTSITVGTTVASVGDTATFSGASIAPTGDVTFTLYSDSSCTSPVSGVSGSGVITTSSGSSTASYSQAWTPSSTGTYYWVASYAGDSNNNGFTTACGAANESVAVSPPPTIQIVVPPLTSTTTTTVASTGGSAPFSVTDAATVVALSDAPGISVGGFGETRVRSQGRTGP